MLPEVGEQSWQPHVLEGFQRSTEAIPIHWGPVSPDAVGAQGQQPLRPGALHQQTMHSAFKGTSERPFTQGSDHQQRMMPASMSSMHAAGAAGSPELCIPSQTKTGEGTAPQAQQAAAPATAWP